MYEPWKMKEVLGNKVAITIYSWTLCKQQAMTLLTPPRTHLTYKCTKIKSLEIDIFDLKLKSDGKKWSSFFFFFEI